VKKIFHVAVREFIATVATKGFILGIVVTPLIMVIAIFGMKLLFNEKAPPIEGEVAVIDPTGQVFDGLHDYLRPEAIAERRDDFQELVRKQIPDEVKQITEATGRGEAAEMALQAMVIDAPKLDVVELDRSSDLDEAKEPLREGDAKTGGRLALVVVHEDAVLKPEDQKQFGRYDLFVKKGLDDRITDEIKGGLRRTIVDARIREAGLDRERIDALTSVGRVRSTTVTEEGEKQTNEVFNFLMPMGFMLLLFISVLSGGQYLMTTTIEEKSSRVVEVLLSAVSPMELMTGKIIGQMCVGFVILGVYGGMGISALIAFAMFGLLDVMNLVYLVIFYLIAYFVMASLMAAIGAAVNEMREAQTFMTPVMLTMVIPWILWAPISRDPNSVFATTMSFIPPVNTFVMMLRKTATTPPPDWQVWLSIAIGIASVYGALWFAAKVFRVGLLMYGKPPDFKTLIRWVRMS
jgi:ABC-type Na+ efflux pump permease subunit